MWLVALSSAISVLFFGNFFSIVFRFKRISSKYCTVTSKKINKIKEQRVHKELLILSLSHSYVGFIVRKLVIGVVAYQNYHDQCMQVWYAKNYDVRMCKQGAGIFTNHKPNVWIAQLAFEVLKLIFTVRVYND